MESIQYIPPQKIEQTADDLRMAYDGSDDFTDVTKIAREIGLTVYEVLFNQKDIDGMIATEDSKTSIYVNKGNSEVRKRFTIAHEIGHYILHHDDSMEQDFIVDYRQAIMNYETQEDLIKETQANMFAAALLLPKDLVKEAWSKYKNIEKVSKLFQVSAKALVIRLDNLGCI